MKLFTSLLALSVSVLPAAFAPSSVLAQSQSTSEIAGVWQGFATVREAQQVPVTIRISGAGSSLKAEFLNGPVEHPDATPASSTSFDNGHLVASFDYFARTLDATITDNKLTATYGSAHPTAKSAASTPLQLTRVKTAVDGKRLVEPPSLGS